AKVKSKGCSPSSFAHNPKYLLSYHPSKTLSKTYPIPTKETSQTGILESLNNAYHLNEKPFLRVQQRSIAHLDKNVKMR
ncbi:MAG: hypothetical protein AAB666_01975, partial [Patescibacteria group bacterium]